MTVSHIPADPTYDEVCARISGTWQNLFGEPDMRIEEGDNFFSLGASSLLAMRMATAVGEELGIPLSVLAIAENPTLNGLSRHVLDLIAARDAREVGEL
ncbi:acyl carrier protein [Peterkaempfera bronchialis]|uniref:Acyl carrier protein n=1 Tax=Peterkaempfera bronchialis TaxID=2126346 RepID=A0A345SYN6_9ACTN|nr:acyl carrier protein [Peterkaempfera bronchialis]AXI78841.1 acyl carrier protein [Peterkaempfera bronchialis]